MPARACLTLATAMLSLLAACAKEPPRALGTLEWDRVTLPAPVAERIIAIDVREGQRVKAGEPLLQLEATSLASQLAAAEAAARQNQALLQELRSGPRREQIAQARAAVSAAEARQSEALANRKRIESLLESRVVAPGDADRARAAAEEAIAQLERAREALRELERGTRPEQINQGEAALQAANAQVATRRAALDKLTLIAPRDAVVDSIPWKLGDQAPVGAPLLVLLAGEAPYARIYVPEPLRAGLQVGSSATVHVEGIEDTWSGTVRMIRSEPNFTPYYALTGPDATRLSYLAEVQLPATAAQLPAGLPVWVEFPP